MESRFEFELSLANAELIKSDLTGNYKLVKKLIHSRCIDQVNCYKYKIFKSTVSEPAYLVYFNVKSSLA